MSDTPESNSAARTAFLAALAQLQEDFEKRLNELRENVSKLTTTALQYQADLFQNLSDLTESWERRRTRSAS
jgi:hypothetical protein